VDLGPPSRDTAVPPEDAAIMMYYHALQYTLYETGYPETVDRCNTPVNTYRSTGSQRVTIAVLSSPVECMGIVLEGNI